MALSPRTTAAMMEPRTADMDITLITLSHPSWGRDYRFCTAQTEWLRNNPDSGRPEYGVMSNGLAYEFVPVYVTLPSSSDEQAPEGKIVMSNVGREISPYLKAVGSSYPRMTIETVNSATPDIVEASWPELDLASANWNNMTVEITVKNNIASTEPLPHSRFNRAEWPNLAA